MVSSAQPECDLVMKGGITSGVIYPRLVARLSKTYRLRSIGGTSAGAIAAAAAAAAQLGVLAASNPKAFEQLAELPTELGHAMPGGGSKLFHLFQPQPGLRRQFAVLASLLEPTRAERVSPPPSVAARAIGVSMALVREFPLGAVIGALPGLLLIAQSWGLARLLGLLVLVSGVALGAAIAALVSFGRELPANYFGMCNGMPADDQKSSLSLTAWLHDYLNGLAGKSTAEPLTFGELWGGKLRAPGESAPPLVAGERVLDLAMMTTAVNLGRPYSIPFESGDVYFIKEEMDQLFPASVVKWLVEHARPSETAATLSAPGRTLRALPRPEDFPVLMGVRLSLSFPILLSTVPLYTIDRTINANRPKVTQATRVYFSDGGLCSNFPVHFFDSPLPSRPTFAVNLRGFHPDHPEERVWLPEVLQNNQGLKNHVPPLSDRPGWGSVFAFGLALVDTMQSWRDQMQLALPGFRDRIVHVSHSKEEGGLNLSMPPDVIRTLADSGVEAAEKLLAAFAGEDGTGPGPGWANHQRIRARTLLCLMQQQLQRIARALATVERRPYADVIADTHPPSYPFADQADADNAQWLARELERIARELASRQAQLCAGAPRPSPDLRVSPRV